jgi:hypothetical protein
MGIFIDLHLIDNQVTGEFKADAGSRASTTRAPPWRRDFIFE